MAFGGVVLTEYPALREYLYVLNHSENSEVFCFKCQEIRLIISQV